MENFYLKKAHCWGHIGFSFTHKAHLNSWQCEKNEVCSCTLGPYLYDAATKRSADFYLHLWVCLWLQEWAVAFLSFTSLIRRTWSCVKKYLTICTQCLLPELPYRNKAHTPTRRASLGRENTVWLKQVNQVGVLAIYYFYYLNSFHNIGSTLLLHIFVSLLTYWLFLFDNLLRRLAGSSDNLIDQIDISIFIAMWVIWVDTFAVWYCCMVWYDKYKY